VLRANFIILSYFSAFRAPSLVLLRRGTDEGPHFAAVTGWAIRRPETFSLNFSIRLRGMRLAKRIAGLACYAHPLGFTRR
jgi:hypothetical protein